MSLSIDTLVNQLNQANAEIAQLWEQLNYARDEIKRLTAALDHPDNVSHTIEAAYMKEDALERQERAAERVASSRCDTPGCTSIDPRCAKHIDEYRRALAAGMPLSLRHG